MKKWHYTAVVFAGCLLWHMSVWADHCTESSAPSVPPAENSSNVPSAGPSLPPATPPATGEPTNVKDQMGLTFNPDAKTNKGGEWGNQNGKKPFGPSDFLKMMRGYLDYARNQIAIKEQELKEKGLMKKWKNESGYNRAQEEYRDKWEDYKKATDQEWKAGDKVRDLQDLSNRAGGKDRELIEKLIQQEKLKPAYQDAVGHRMVVEQETNDAATEFDNSIKRLNALEANYHSSQTAEVPELKH